MRKVLKSGATSVKYNICYRFVTSWLYGDVRFGLPLCISHLLPEVVVTNDTKVSVIDVEVSPYQAQ